MKVNEPKQASFVFSFQSLTTIIAKVQDSNVSVTPNSIFHFKFYFLLLMRMSRIVQQRVSISYTDITK